MKDEKLIASEVEKWLDNVVIGLELCPFAKRPRRLGQIDIVISSAESIEVLLMELLDQLACLESLSKQKVETMLLVFPNLLSDFDDYLDCLYLAEELMIQQGWRGIFQLASFHPQYQFDGTAQDDVENLTNRSPYPIFHILREQSLSVAIESYGDTAEIPKRNTRKLKGLGIEQLKRLF